MPTLKQLTCNVEWSGGSLPLQEFATVYGDGHVQTFIAVPSIPTPFSVHLRSNGYIAPGLAMYVYMDGEYQCNRFRQNLRPPEEATKILQTEVDFRVRQKEETLEPGGFFIGRQWKFEKLNIVTGDNDDVGRRAPHDAEYVGTIEVVVLRCYPAEVPRWEETEAAPLIRSAQSKRTKRQKGKLAPPYSSPDSSDESSDEATNESSEDSSSSGESSTERIPATMGNMLDGAIVDSDDLCGITTFGGDMAWDDAPQDQGNSQQWDTAPHDQGNPQQWGATMNTANSGHYAPIDQGTQPYPGTLDRRLYDSRMNSPREHFNQDWVTSGSQPDHNGQFHASQNAQTRGRRRGSKDISPINNRSLDSPTGSVAKHRDANAATVTIPALTGAGSPAIVINVTHGPPAPSVQSWHSPKASNVEGKQHGSGSDKRSSGGSNNSKGSKNGDNGEDTWKPPLVAGASMLWEDPGPDKWDPPREWTTAPDPPKENSIPGAWTTTPNPPQELNTGWDATENKYPQHNGARGALNDQTPANNTAWDTGKNNGAAPNNHWGATDNRPQSNNTDWGNNITGGAQENTGLNVSNDQAPGINSSGDNGGNNGANNVAQQNGSWGGVGVGDEKNQNENGEQAQKRRGNNNNGNGWCTNDSVKTGSNGKGTFVKPKPSPLKIEINHFPDYSSDPIYPFPGQNQSSIPGGRPNGDDVPQTAAGFSIPINPVAKPYWFDFNKITEVDNKPQQPPEEPLYSIPAKVAQRKNLSHQVHTEKPAPYVHKVLCARHMDTHDHPYAVFTFNYRSKAILEQMLNTTLTEPEGVEKQRLSCLSKEELIEHYLKAKASTRNSDSNSGSYKSAVPTVITLNNNNGAQNSGSWNNGVNKNGVNSNGVNSNGVNNNGGNNNGGTGVIDFGAALGQKLAHLQTKSPNDSEKPSTNPENHWGRVINNNNSNNNGSNGNKYPIPSGPNPNPTVTTWLNKGGGDPGPPVSSPTGLAAAGNGNGNGNTVAGAGDNGTQKADTQWGGIEGNGQAGTNWGAHGSGGNAGGGGTAW